jgi:hypothetical protein
VAQTTVADTTVADTVVPETIAPDTTTATATSPPASKMAPEAGDCSAAGTAPEVPADPSLPEPVAAMRADLARAAATCDWSALALLVDRGGTGVRASFGDDSDPIGYWQGLEQTSGPDAADPKPLRALVAVLALPGTVQALDADHTQYVWPPAHASDAPTEAELEQVAETGLYTIEELRAAAADVGSYLGYRVLITADGDWTAFVAGD